MLAIIAALIAASGLFSLFDKSLKAASKPRLQKEADDANVRHQGRAKRYRLVLRALENPSRYFMASRFWIVSLRSCAAIAAGLGIAIIYESAAMPFFLAAAAYAAAFVLAILFLEDIASRVANRLPESVSAAALPLIEFFSLPLRPFIALIQSSEKQMQKIFPRRAEHHGMTEDELRHALNEGEKSGIVESKEKTMVEGVFYLGDRPLGTFMTHRSDIQWLDISAPAEDLRAKVLEYREQRCFPVADGTLDSIIGAAYPEDIILDFASGSPNGLKAIMKKPLFAPETMPALKAFESFRRGKADFLFVMDEYGGFAGMVSLHGLMEEIVGEFAASAADEDEAVQQADGTWLVDGGINIDDAADLLSLPELSAAHGDYHTLAGFVLSLAGELPLAGDAFLSHGYRFTVLDMDGNRIDKIGIKKEEE
ncbi:MAG: hemolysin family protein [Treponema sp.]|jgi:putative hemolysin|nr:hemolysin family protein [Treponema sp.]